jgi:exodeoxyribonuclease VII small subunit
VTDRESISYEQARDELAAVVRRLEAGGLTLEQSLDLWERGEKLAAVCAEWLDGARARLTTAMAAREAAGAGGRGEEGPADEAGGEGGRGNSAKDGAGAKDIPF